MSDLTTELELPAVSGRMARMFRKLRLFVARKVLRRSALRVRVFDYDLFVPLRTGGIGKALAIYGARELDQRYVIQQKLRQGQTVFDLGANIGYYCVMEAKAVGREGFVYACEPDPRSVEFLKRNVALNGLDANVEFHQVAVSNHAGEADFSLADQANMSSLGTIRDKRREVVETVSVRTRDFVEMLEAFDRPVDLVRMDVEGHEVEVLGSLADRLDAEPSFAKAPACFVFEPHSREYDDSHDFRPILNRLLQHGYEVTCITSADEADSPMKQFGMSPVVTIPDSSRLRGIYDQVTTDQAIDLICNHSGVRTVCFERRKPKS